MGTSEQTRNPAESRSSAGSSSDLAAGGLTERQVTVIAEIARAGQTGITARDVAKVMGVEPERVRKLVNSLPPGLVEKREDPESRRQRLYTAEAGTIVVTQVRLPGGYVLAQLPGSTFAVYQKSRPDERPMIVGYAQDKASVPAQATGAIEGRQEERELLS